MSMKRVVRGTIAVLAGIVLMVAAWSAEAREPRGSTTSDGPSSPYTDASKKKNKPSKTTPTPKPSSNNKWICESNCPYPSGSSQQNACIQKCLDRLSSRSRR